VFSECKYVVAVVNFETVFLTRADFMASCTADRVAS